MKKYQSFKLAQKRKRQLKLKFILILIICLSVIFTLSVFSKYDRLNINKIKIKGNSFVPTKDLKEIVNKNLSANYFWLFSKRNVLIYPKKDIKEEIMKEFSRIKKVDLDLDFPNLLKINVFERNTHALWCGLASTTECFLVDDKGLIFSHLDNATGEGIFRYYTSLESKFKNDLVIKQSVFDVSFFNEVDSFIQFIEGLNLEPYKLVEKENKYEIYFGDQNSRIIFNKDQSVKKIMNNFQSILNMKEFFDIENFKKIEYIDLRFGNKVFYK